MHLTIEKITTYVDLERDGWFLSDHLVRYDACHGHIINIFCFISSSAVCSCLAAPFLSVNLFFFRFLLLNFLRCLTTTLPASFAYNPDLSPASGLDGLCLNIAAIGETQSWYLPSGTRPSLQKSWGRAFCQKSLDR